MGTGQATPRSREEGVPIVPCSLIVGLDFQLWWWIVQVEIGGTGAVVRVMLFKLNRGVVVTVRLAICL